LYCYLAGGWPIAGGLVSQDARVTSQDSFGGGREDFRNLDQPPQSAVPTRLVGRLPSLTSSAPRHFSSSLPSAMLTLAMLSTRIGWPSLTLPVATILEIPSRSFIIDTSRSPKLFPLQLRGPVLLLDSLIG